MCQSGQDPKVVNDLIEQVLDYYWPYNERDRDGKSYGTVEELCKMFGIEALGAYIVPTWEQYEVKYNKRFGKEMCTRELDKFFLTETIRTWDHDE